MSEFSELLRRECAGVCAISDGEAAALERHYRLLCAWNARLNLTRITELGAAVRRHYAEGIVLASHLPPGRLRIADVGSGAGFPGIPVAVMRPECEVTLIESHQRKAVFLREAARGLGNVRVVGARAEEVGMWGGGNAGAGECGNAGTRGGGNAGTRGGGNAGMQGGAEAGMRGGGNAGMPEGSEAGTRVVASDANRGSWVISRAVRWQDVLESGLACNYALLLSAADAAAASTATRGFTWNILTHPVLGSGTVLLVGNG